MFKSAHELVQEAKQHIREGNADAIGQQLTQAGALLIDVREPEEFNQGHLAQALNIPRGMLEFRISNDPALHDVQRPLAIYCKSSGRAALAAQTLAAMGFENVISLAGGFDAWVAEGRPATKPTVISFE